LNRLSKKNETQLRGFCPRGGKIPSIGSYVFIITESCVPLVTDFSVVLFTDNIIPLGKNNYRILRDLPLSTTLEGLREVYINENVEINFSSQKYLSKNS